MFEAKPDGEKFYLTVAYPYVSGPMHIGHARTYTVPDAIARYKRMKGFNVLFPMAYHFTGTPIVGAAKRVAKKDPQLIKLLTEFYKVPAELLKDFENPHFFATYFAREDPSSYRSGMEALGLSIDWKREFTTVDPHYKKFIGWQYRKLWNAGLIVKGRHPVKWCPSCGNPVTDHDLLEGEGVEILEFTLLKYRMENYMLPAATLRPETVFGVTNIWLNPDAKYVVAEVDGERWIVSEEAVEKLEGQGYRIGNIQPFQIDFAKKVEVPLTHKKVPILPAKFVDPDNATGVVGSVPAHAPYDYVALLELQKNPTPLKKFGLDEREIARLKPVSIIRVEGFGEFPAIDVVERLEIRSQNDRKLEEATAEVYRNEFAKGVMREWVPGFGGLPVHEAKSKVKEEMIERGEAAIMHEFAVAPVICRCGARVVIKVVEDQWFIDYRNEEWKKKARECLSKMHLVPPETRAQFEHVIEWLREWPCTRKIGMGTPAPWSPDWIIESLSDSTIYMAYYTIAHIIKTIPPEKLSDEIFDYVFYGKGDAGEISSRSGVERDKLELMRREFDYWYPLDYRMSAYELIPNHLTFHIFHHALLFAQKCPKGILNFGMVSLEGRKMSSSKGNLVSVGDAINQCGADAIRLYLLSVSEPWQDLDWKKSEVVSVQKSLGRFFSLAGEIIAMPGGGLPIFDQPEKWLMNKLHRCIQETTEALESFETRKAVQSAFFGLLNHVKHYMKRAENQEAKAYVLKKLLDVWLRLLAPFIPHTCEELWSRLNKKGFISVASWPKVDVGMIDETAEFAEDYLERVVEDVLKIKKVFKKPLRLICIYTAQEWKWNAMRIAAKTLASGEKNIGRMVRRVEEELGLRLYKSELPKILQKMVELLEDMPQERLEILKTAILDEYSILKNAAAFLSKQLGGEIRIFRADDPARFDPRNKAVVALPTRPAIYIQ